MWAAAGLLAAAPASAAQRPVVPYEQVAPILDQLAEDEWPAGLRSSSVEKRRAAWASWARQHDEETRARVARGEEDTLVNLVLYGVSFTREPRLAERDVALQLTEHRARVNRRIADFVRGLAVATPGDRLAFAREVLTTAGIRISSPSGPRRARAFVSDLIDRYAAELRHYVEASVRQERLATLFRDRGLSSDTSIHPGFAVEQALAALQGAGLISPVTRAAIVGPGLDVADKREGLDIYPIQSIQPFALVDSLLRLGLARASDLRLTTFDLSPRVNQHLAGAVSRATQGEPYQIELGQTGGAAWIDPLVRYWEAFGDQIGRAVSSTRTPRAPGVRSRAVLVRAEVVQMLDVRDLDVVVEAPASPAGGARFDVIVATNTLIYYDRFEQSLALLNLARMLRRGGWLFVNDALPPVPAIPLIPMGWTELKYSNQTNSHERLTWYRRR